MRLQIRAERVRAEGFGGFDGDHYEDLTFIEIRGALWMKWLSLLLALSLTSCLAPTAYQSDGTDGTGGHVFQRVSEDTFLVKFHGNGVTTPKRAKDFALLRAAELCRDHGFRYFSVVGEDDNTKTDIAHLGSTSNTFGTVNPYGGFNATTTTYQSSIPVSKPRPSVMVKCYIRPPGGHSGPVKEASQVIAEIRQAYKLP